MRLIRVTFVAAMFGLACGAIIGLSLHAGTVTRDVLVTTTTTVAPTTTSTIVGVICTIDGQRVNTGPGEAAHIGCRP